MSDAPEGWPITLIKGGGFGLVAGGILAAITRLVDSSRYKASVEMQRESAAAGIVIPRHVSADPGMLEALTELRTVQKARPTTFRRMLTDIGDLVTLWVDAENLDARFLHPRMCSIADALRSSVRSHLAAYLEDSMVPLVPHVGSEFYGQPIDELVREAVSKLLTGLDGYVTNITVEVNDRRREYLEAAWREGRVDGRGLPIP